jgi:hypothetical protein
VRGEYKHSRSKNRAPKQNMTIFGDKISVTIETISLNLQENNSTYIRAPKVKFRFCRKGFWRSNFTHFQSSATNNGTRSKNRFGFHGNVIKVNRACSPPPPPLKWPQKRGHINLLHCRNVLITGEFDLNVLVARRSTRWVCLVEKDGNRQTAPFLVRWFGPLDENGGKLFYDVISKKKSCA